MIGPNDTRVYIGDVPMPEAISWMLLALTSDPVATGWNTETHRLEYFTCPKAKAEEIERTLGELYRNPKSEDLKSEGPGAP